MISESSHGDPWNRLRSVRWAARVASLSLGLIGLLAIVAFARMVGPPPRTSTIDASAWLLSCIGAALMAYLTAIIVLGLLARVGPWDGAIRALDRVTIAPIRRLLDAAIGGAFALAVVGGPAGASSSVPVTHLPASSVPVVVGLGDGGAPLLVRLSPHPSASARSGAARPVERAQTPATELASEGRVGPALTERPGRLAPPADPVLVPFDEAVLVAPDRVEPPGLFAEPGARSASMRVPEPPGAARVSSPIFVSAPGSVAEPVLTDSRHSESPIAQGGTWRVRQGDHLWSIAERTVARYRPDPSDHDIAKYWLALLAANRHRLVDPDRIYPGQDLVLPHYS